VTDRPYPSAEKRRDDPSPVRPDKTRHAYLDCCQHAYVQLFPQVSSCTNTKTFRYRSISAEISATTLTYSCFGALGYLRVHACNISSVPTSVPSCLSAVVVCKRLVNVSGYHHHHHLLLPLPSHINMAGHVRLACLTFTRPASLHMPG
jgi:hypothetical protein